METLYNKISFVNVS